MNYKKATVEEISSHFKSISRQAVEKASKYYFEKGNIEVFDKIQAARDLIRLEKVEARRQELSKVKSNSTPFKCYTVDGTVNTSEQYSVWNSMMKRCTSDSKTQLACPTYVDCSVSRDFENFEFFFAWCCNQAGFGEKDEHGRVYHLDKDLLIKNNRVYSEDTCVFIPNKINQFIKLRRLNEEYPLGVCKHSQNDSYVAQSKDLDDKHVYLGSYKTIEDAFLAYKKFKESMAKLLAFKYKDTIDPRAFSALMNFEVNIDD